MFPYISVGMHFTCLYLGSENVQIPVYCMMVTQTSLRSVQSEFQGDINLGIAYLSVLNFSIWKI
jgi:hypothetical protein